MSEPAIPPVTPPFTAPEAEAMAAEHFIHWWREPIAGIASLAIGCYDTWMFGRDKGLTASLDEILIISGVVLIAGSRRLFGGLNGKNGNGK